MNFWRLFHEIFNIRGMFSNWNLETIGKHQVFVRIGFFINFCGMYSDSAFFFKHECKMKNAFLTAFAHKFSDFSRFYCVFCPFVNVLVARSITHSYILEGLEPCFILSNLCWGLRFIHTIRLQLRRRHRRYSISIGAPPVSPGPNFHSVFGENWPNGRSPPSHLRNSGSATDMDLDPICNVVVVVIVYNIVVYRNIITENWSLR